MTRPSTGPGTRPRRIRATSRQAVVLIHGIGEQKPMGTVRSFVKAVLRKPSNVEGPAYWSKPDDMSHLFELRLLRSRGRPSTDFYEYYWAYQLSGTKLGDLGRWLFGLALRRRKDVPPSARSLWFIGRVTIGLLIVSLVLGGGAIGYDFFAALPKAGLAWISIIGALLIVQSILISYLGDAARYLSPLPHNIQIRQTIRSECVTLLKALHDSKKYDRIIVVGHSLGSIIGFDALTRLWQQYHQSLPGLELPEPQAEIREQMATGRSPQPVIREQLSLAAAALRDNGAGVVDFQKSQMEAWREQRYLGNPWLITDFITLGSPLAHAVLLMADSRRDFDERCGERELPTCPPARDEKAFAFSAASIPVGEGKQFTPLMLHHAAPFAVTRWTNIYFPAALGLFGDIVGGPLRRVFGLGIRDVPVSTTKWKGVYGRTLLAHKSYWDATEDAGDEGRKRGGRVDALAALRQALALSSLGRFTRPQQRMTPDQPVGHALGDGATPIQSG